MQCANSAFALTLLTCDTRITALFVGLPDKVIPKHILEHARLMMV